MWNQTLLRKVDLKRGSQLILQYNVARDNYRKWQHVIAVNHNDYIPIL